MEPLCVEYTYAIDIGAGLPAEERLSDFEAFVRSNEAAIISLALVYSGNPEDAHDLAQETFARVWENWERLASHVNREAWSRRVLHNLAMSKWRRLKLERRHSTAAVPATAVGPDASHLDIIARINQLSARERQALVLHDVIGLSVDEVAAEMRVPAGTVRSWLHRARSSLAAGLGRTAPIGSREGTGEGDHVRRR